MTTRVLFSIIDGTDGTTTSPNFSSIKGYSPKISEKYSTNRPILSSLPW